MILKLSSNQKKKGFTLIELIAVIAIISVLAASLAPKLSGYIDEAKKVSVLDQAKRVITAYESLTFKNNSLNEGSTIKNVADASNGLLILSEITKIPDSFTVLQCRNLLDTEQFNFSIADGKATAPTAITAAVPTP